MKHRILIVEDEPLVALDLRETLEEAGFDVAACVDSADLVIPQVLGGQLDLILMDIRLRSYLDGIDAAGRVSLLSKLPIVFLTAYSTPDILKRVDSFRPAAFLVKPAPGPLLVDTIRRVLKEALPRA